MIQFNACTICQNEITKKYCSNCGQKVSISDTTLKSLILDFISNLFSLEKSVFAGMMIIITNPKKIIVNYWLGHRNYYPSPSKLLVFAIAIAALHLTYVNENLLGLAFEVEGGGGQFIFWIIFFPFLSFTSYVCFYRKKYSLAKHVISIGYIASCFFMITTVVNDLLNYFSIDVNVLAFIIFLMLVFIWNGRVFISKQNVIKIILFSFLQLFVFCLLFAGLVGILILALPDSIQYL